MEKGFAHLLLVVVVVAIVGLMAFFTLKLESQLMPEQTEVLGISTDTLDQPWWDSLFSK